MSVPCVRESNAHRQDVPLRLDFRWSLGSWANTSRDAYCVADSLRGPLVLAPARKHGLVAVGVDRLRPRQDDSCIIQFQASVCRGIRLQESTWRRRRSLRTSRLLGPALFLLSSPYSVFIRCAFQGNNDRSRRTRMVFRRWLLLGLALIFTPAVFAGGPTGTITGTVTDPTGAVVRKARITVVNEATNAQRSAETNDDGDYTVALLPPGRYRVTTEMSGFRRSVFSDVPV